MASGYRSNNVDFDDLFEPESNGNGITLSGIRKDGSGLRYASRGSTAKRDDVGYRVDGQDVSNVWMAKGTTTVVRGGVPDNISRSRAAPQNQQVTLNAFLTYDRNGSVSWGGGGIGTAGSGQWISNASSTVGDNYDINVSTTSQSGDGALTGSNTGWQQMSVSRSVALQTTTTNDARFGTVGLNVQIRRRSDNVVMLNFNTNMTVQISNSG